MRILMLTAGYGPQGPALGGLERLGSLGQLEAALADPPDVLLIDGEAPEVQDLARLRGLVERAGCPLVWLADCHDRAGLRAPLGELRASHVLPRSDGTLRAEVVAVLQALDLQRRGVAQWASWSVLGAADRALDAAPREVLALRASRQRDEALEGFGAWMEAREVPKRIATLARGVADEMIINALYNAPTDAEGRPLFRSLPRTEAVELSAHHEASFSYASDGVHLALSVRDPYGSLSARVVWENLARTLSAGADQIDQKEGGAGLGLYTILQSATRLSIHLEPGSQTVFRALFALDKNHRAFLARPKAFHLFVMDGGQGSSGG